MSKSKKEHNAIKFLYEKKYEVDKQFRFTWPILKTDVEAYANILMNTIDKAVDIAEHPRIEGHRGLIYRPESKKKKTPEEEETTEDKSNTGSTKDEVSDKQTNKRTGKSRTYSGTKGKKKTSK